MAKLLEKNVVRRKLETGGNESKRKYDDEFNKYSRLPNFVTKSKVNSSNPA